MISSINERVSITHSDIRIVPAAKKDFDFLADLIDECADEKAGNQPFKRERYEYFRDDGVTIPLPDDSFRSRLFYYVVYRGKVKVGVISNSRRYGAGIELVGICIKKEFRYQGTGTNALKLFIDWRVEKSELEVKTLVSTYNIISQKMCRKIGGIVVGMKPYPVSNGTITCVEYLYVNFENPDQGAPLIQNCT